MPDTIEQEVKVKVSAEVDDSLTRLGKSIARIAEDSNKMGSMVSNSFLNMGKQIENSTKNLNLGATFKNYFDNIAKSSASAASEVKNNLKLVENALGKLPGLAKEKVEIRVNISQTQAELDKVNNKIKETKILLKELADYKPSGGRATKALIALDESSLLKSSLQKDKVAWQEYYKEVSDKQKGLMSEVYTKTGEVSNTIINQLTTNAKRSSSLIREVVDSQIVSLQRIQGMTGKFSPDTKNILVNKSMIDSAKKEYNELNTYVVGLQRSLTEAIKAEQTARFAYEQQYAGAAKEQSRLLAENALVNLKKITKEHEEAVAHMNKLQQAIGTGNIAQKSNIAGVQKAYAQGGLKYVMGFTVEELQAEGDLLKSKLKTLFNEMITISKNTSKGAISRGKEILPEFENVKGQFDLLKNTVSKKILELKSLTSKGMINATPDIIALQQLEGKFTEYAASIRNQAQGLGKMTRSQLEQGAKGFFTKFWEGFRDLRWQVAAAAYMFNYFVKGVINNFDDALNKISEFNKEVMGLAATIGIAMGKFAPQFSTTFEYSAEVLTKLQAAAAGTYLKMEDLQMIVRTFAMHGMFPKSDQDIKSLVTIASGVKILTEGMANEGVQMRQEIDALLSGRARITDTLAKTFKNAGIDIKAEMLKWQAEGISAMSGLARAMQPLAEMNTKIIDQYAAQKNLLKSNYEYIQRTYLSGLHKAVGEFLVGVNKSLGAPGEYIGETGKAIGELILIWNTSLAVLGKEIINIASVIMEAFSNLGSVFVGKDGLAGGLEVAIKFAYLLSYSLTVTLHTVVLLLGGFKAIAVALYGISRILVGDFTEGIRLIEQAWNDVTLSLVNYYRSMDIASDRFKSNWSGTGDLVEKIITKVNYSMNKMQSMKYFIDVSEANSALKQLEINLDKVIEKYKPKTEKIEDVINQTWEDYNAKMVVVNTTLYKLQVEQKALFEAMKRDSKEAMGNVTSDMEVLVKRYKDAIAESGIGGIQINKETNVGIVNKKAKELKDLYEINKAGKGFENIDISEVMDSPIAAERAAMRELNATIRKNEQLQKEQEKATTLTKKAIDELNAIKEAAYNKDYLTYINYLEKINEDTLNSYDKLKMETNHLYQEVRLMPDPHGIIKDNLPTIDMAIYERSLRKEVELTQKKEDEIKDLLRRSSGKELSDFQKIQEEKEDMVRKTNQSQLMSTEEKIRMIEALEINSLARIAKKKWEHQIELQQTQTETLTLQAKWLETSIRPMDLQEAKIMNIVAAYKQQEIQIYKNIEAKEVQLGKDSEAFAAFKEQMMMQLALQRQMAEYSIKEVQEPFWAKMKEMTKEWSDQLADALTDLIFDFENFGKSMSNLFKSIAKDVVKAFIKTKFIDPMMNSLGGSPGSGGGIFTEGIAGGAFNPLKLLGMSGGGGSSKPGLDQLLSKWDLKGTPASPMYVTVTNLPSSGLTGGESSGGIPNFSSFGGTSSSTNLMGNTSWSKNIAKDLGFTPDKEMQGMAYYVANGFSPAQAAGIMGNFSVETGRTYSTSILGDAGSALGVGQWRGPRRTNLENFAGANIGNYQTQLEFSNWEFQNTHAGALRALQQTSTPSEAALAVSSRYEIPNPRYANNALRQSESERIFNNYQQQNTQAMETFNTNLNSGADNLGEFSSNVDFSASSVTNWDAKLSESFKPEKLEEMLKPTASSSLASTTGGLASTTGVINITAQMVNVNGTVSNGAGGTAAAGSIPGTGGSSSRGGGGSTGGWTEQQRAVADNDRYFAQAGYYQYTSQGNKTGYESAIAESTKQTTSMFSGFFSKMQELFSGLFGMIKSLFSGIADMLGGLLKGIGSLFSGGSGGSGGGLFGMIGGLFGGSGGSGGGSSPFAMVGSYEGYASGGILREPVFGIGLNTGTKYSFGESGSEIFMPESEYNPNTKKSKSYTDSIQSPVFESGQSKSARDDSVQQNIHMSIHVNAIDTQSGVDFIMKNSKLYENMIGRALKNNKNIRKEIRNAY